MPQFNRSPSMYGLMISGTLIWSKRGNLAEANLVSEQKCLKCENCIDMLYFDAIKPESCAQFYLSTKSGQPP